jgi:hypothetical protein
MNMITIKSKRVTQMSLKKSYIASTSLKEHSREHKFSVIALYLLIS